MQKVKVVINQTVRRYNVSHKGIKFSSATNVVGVGKSAYDIYKETTTDNPILSESAWIASLYGHDGITPTIGPNGNWFIGDTDTGTVATTGNVVPEKPYFNVPMKCPIPYVGLESEIEDGWSLCDGRNVAGYGLVPDMRGRFIVGADPRTASIPTNSDTSLKNYGTAGNTGGKDNVQLAITELPKHSFKTVIAGNNNEPPLRNNNDASIVDIRDDRSDGNSDYSLDGKAGVPTLGKTNTVGDDQPHENRPPYYVVAFIIRTTYQNANGGRSAYEIALLNGFIGTEAEWLTSLNGKSAYQIALDYGFVGTIEQWILSLKGNKGDNGVGITGIERTSGSGAAGTTDTYTINYSNNTSSTYTVVNGSNGNPGENGRGIVSNTRISGNGAAGITDTYRITYTDGSTTDYTVVNGANGIESLVAGTNVNIDITDPKKPVISFTNQDLSNLVVQVPGKSLISDTEIERLSGVSNVDISGKENIGVAAQLISDLKAGVPDAGDTLLKLFNEIGLKINRSETLTATEIQLLVSNLVDSSPETLNTLKELAAALANDPNFATTITTLIGTKLNASKAAIEALLTGLITTHYHTAAATTFVPFVTITAGTVQAAIEQMYSEKASQTTANYLLTEIANMKRLAGISDGWVGRRWDPAQPGMYMSLVTSAGILNDFFSKFKVVALGDNGQEIATLATGNSAMSGDLTGANGQIMLKIPQIYYREIFNIAGERCGIDLSLTPVSGFKLHEKFSWGNGRGEIYVGCFEGGEVAAKMTSVTGVPVSTSKTIAEFRSLALARGTGWHAYDYYTHHLLEMLFYVYYGKLNSQEALPGYTEPTWAENFKKNTGLIAPAGWPRTAQGNDDGGWTGTSRVIGNSFLWIENLYGHVWKFLDGCVFDGRVSKQNTAYLTPNPLLFSSVDSEILSRYINMNIDLPAASNENYLSSTGALGLPKTHGGDSSTYVTDYFWSYLDDATRDYLRVVVAGGCLDHGARAGVAARLSSNGLGLAYAGIGSRLCYEKN